MILCSLFVATLRAQSAQSPTWPQKFTVEGPEASTFGFAVTQPGTIAVEIQTQGAPVVATLLGPAPQPIQQQGSGVLRLSYNALPQDVQKSVFWTVSIRLAQPASPGQAAVANGVIGVQSPPVDRSQVEAAVRAVQAQAQTARPQLEAAAAQGQERLRAQIGAALQQQRSELQQQQTQRRAALMTQAQPAVERLRAAQRGGAVTTRAVKGPQTGVLRAPSEAARMLTIAPAMAALSVGTGQPGDPIVINGTNFGSAGGEVHFQIAPTADVIAVKDVVWTDTQIVATVPGPNNGGLVAFNGNVYVKRPDQMRSNALPFGFVPTMERRMILIPSAAFPPVTSDSVLPRYAGDELVTVSFLGIKRRNSQCFYTPRGEDRFFINTRLKNGWKVYGTPLVYSAHSFNTGGGAYLTKSFVGTDGPYVDVRWWINIGAFCFFSEFGYAVTIPIEGPLGTPDGVVAP